MRTRLNIIAVSVACGLLVWTVDAFLDYLVFYERSFLELLITDVPNNELYARLVMFACFLIPGMLIARMAAQRTRAEETLRESEAKYRTLFEQTSEGIMAVRGVIIECNNAAARILRMRKEDIIGKTPADFAPPVQRGKRDTRELQQAIWSKAYAGEPQRFDWQALRADGAIVEVEVSLKAIELRQGPAILATARDVTEMRKTAAALRESEERYHILFNNMAEGVLVAEIGTRRLRFANPAICEMLGYSHDELVSMTVSDIHPRDALPSVLLAFERLSRGEMEAASEVPCLRKDGSIIYADIHSGIASIKDVEYNIGLFTDVTERKLRDEQMARVNRELQRLNRAKSEFVAIASHEIRTPLTSIIALSGALLDPSIRLTDDVRARGLRTIHKEGRRLGRMVSAMLDLSRIERGTFELRRALLPLADLLREIVEAAPVPADKSVHIDVRSTEPVYVNADRDRITQVVLNILDNALRYTVAGGTVTITLDADSRIAQIGIRDQGPGIAPEERERVFEPFYQSQVAGDRQVRGAGLGLSLAKQIVEAHGGQIRAESKLGHGTEVVFTLPRTAVPQPA